MKLRSQIFLFLLVLGLAPLLTSVIMNVPQVLDRLELFYHKAYLEKLRTDFRDLDQHITRRHEMVRLFAKLPEPGIALANDPNTSEEDIANARLAYTDWANRVLFDQLDIIQLIFIDKSGDVSFSLDRSSDTGILTVEDHLPDVPDLAFLSAGFKLAPGSVLTSPISFNEDVSEADVELEPEPLRVGVEQLGKPPHDSEEEECEERPAHEAPSQASPAEICAHYPHPRPPVSRAVASYRFAGFAGGSFPRLGPAGDKLPSA